jgi:S-adenosylmethionine:tRNA ribosyltransferase-isomerase
MRKQDFDYHLPEALIAQAPLPERSASRLLCASIGAGSIRDLGIRDLPQLLRAGDLLVVNNTRVWPARLYGQKASGGQVELLLERRRDASSGWFHLRVSKKPQIGSVVVVGAIDLHVRERQDALFLLERIDGGELTALLDAHGRVPLPPYVTRADDSADRERYQTVFARDAGSAAAPTAGLHFDAPLLESLAARGVQCAAITLHVGAGTFQNLREDDVDKVVLHQEWLDVPAAAVEAIHACKAQGGRVIAVGTTVTRALETAAIASAPDALRPFQGETQLFIRPGFRFQVVDGLLTNFHLPQSSLLMLVSAFAGREFVLRAYAHAVAERYRFFSYGDASLWLP